VGYSSGVVDFRLHCEGFTNLFSGLFSLLDTFALTEGVFTDFPLNLLFQLLLSFEATFLGLLYSFLALLLSLFELLRLFRVLFNRCHAERRDSGRGLRVVDEGQ
jgi:hypothetical protein